MAKLHFLFIYCIINSIGEQHMQWKKDPEKKYTDLCIYIDKNIPNIVEPGEHPDIENTVYNYL